MEKCLIGTGNTAAVYEWGNNKVLKLFYEGYPGSAVKKEYANALAVKELDFPKPIPYELIHYEERLGIIYEKVPGESLENHVLKTGDLDGCALYMSNLHKQILKWEQRELSDYREFLEYHIQNAKSSNPFLKEEALQILKRLPEGNTLCHGDFHPGNILISGINTCVIDFMNLCRGNDLYDIARTFYLVEYTPVRSEVEDKEFLLNAKKVLAQNYLSGMGVTKDMIREYLIVIKAARNGECPNE